MEECASIPNSSEPCSSADHIAWTDTLQWIRGDQHPHDVDAGTSVPLVTFRPNCFYHDLAQRTLNDAGISNHLAVVCPTFAALNTAVAAGSGIALINTRNQRDGTTAWEPGAALTAAPKVAQICRVRPHAPPAANDLAEVLTTIASTE